MMFLIKILEKHNKLSWFFVILIAGIVFYFSSLTFAYGSKAMGFESIIYHIVIFFLLAIFLLTALINGKINKRDFIFIAIIIALVYALFDEFHQLFVSGRSCSFSDFLLDSAGILFATFIYILSLKFRKITAQL